MLIMCKSCTINFAHLNIKNYHGYKTSCCSWRNCLKINMMHKGQYEGESVEVCSPYLSSEASE